jgi:phage tail sheath protein FI
MSIDKFKFVSPGIFINEIDNSQLPKESEAVGPVVIGRLERGPGMRPVKVKSFSEFVEIFGEPIPGGYGGDVWREGNKTAPTYAAYAAQAWLRNNSPLTVVRLLGTQHTNNTTAGKAGWQTQNSAGTFTGIGAADTDGGAYGLFIVDSGSRDDLIGSNPAPGTGTLAAIWYLNQGSICLTGSGRDGTVTFSGSAVLIKSLGADKEFRAEVRNSAGSLTKTTTFNFNRNSKKYIRKVFNTNPILTNLDVSTGANTASYWLGETFERYLDNFVTGSTQYGVILGLRGDAATREQSDFKYGAQAPQSGWLFSQDTQVVNGVANSYQPENMTQLFRFVGIDTGEWAQANLKISIQDVRSSTNPDDPYGTFTVVIRRAQDSDNAVKIVERYSLCNLNPFSENYVAKKIGDMYVTWDDTERRYREYGNYPNMSKFIRMEMNPDVDAATTNPVLLPFGFYGPVRHKGFTILSGSSAFYDLNVSSLAAGNEFAEVYTKGGNSSPATVRANAEGSMVHLGNGSTQYTASYLFPTMLLRSSSNGGNLSNPKQAYWGIETAINSTSVRHDPGYGDLVRALPVGYNSFTPDTTRTEYAFIFTLDDIVTSAGQGVYISGSRALGTSATAQSSSNSEAALTLGYDRFTLPIHGGFNGLNIVEKEPFNNTDLNGGTMTTNYGFNSVKRAIDCIADPEVVEMNLLTMPGLTNVPLTEHMIKTCEDRGDALAIIDLEGGFVPGTENTNGDNAAGNRGDVDTTVSNLTNRGLNTSYGCAYYPWVRIRDTINGASIWAPPSVAALGVMASSERESELWFAPAGFTRGGLSEGSAGVPVIGVRERLTSEQRDKLYAANINPIATFPSEGIVVFGQKTLQLTRSALDRINVRRLMIFLKKEVSRMAATILFDQNVKSTWNRFLGKVKPFLESVQVRLGLTDWKVVLDETTTTPDLIDRNVLYAKIFLKPARAIEFIAIDFVITDSGASFDD